MSQPDDIAELHRAFDDAIAASMPAHAMASYLAAMTESPTAILAIGKASGPMAQACRDAGLTGKGMLITHDPSVDVDGFDVFVGGHPVPHEGSVEAAQAAVNFVQALTADDHLLVLMSGGGSALMAMPAEGLSLDDKMMIHQTLLNSGMDIHQMNTIRRLVSGVKGGRLARLAAPARITQWVMSDVPATGNKDHDLSAIASGPFAGDPMALDDGKRALTQAGLDHHDILQRFIKTLEDHPDLGPVRLGADVLDTVETTIIASNEIARSAAEKALGEITITLPDLQGEAMIMGARIAEMIMDAGKPVTGVTGGETVVTIDADGPCGKGGRSQELALSFLVAMSGYAEKGHDVPPFLLLAGGTDGRDGPTDAAGALVTDAMITSGHRLAAWREALRRHDSYPVLESCSALLKMPPTGTNLGDLVIIKTG